MGPSLVSKVNRLARGSEHWKPNTGSLVCTNLANSTLHHQSPHSGPGRSYPGEIGSEGVVVLVSTYRPPPGPDGAAELSREGRAHRDSG